MPKQKTLIECLRSGDLAQVKASLRSNPEAARSPRAIGEAARRGWTSAVELLLKNGADLNANWRNYRPLHALIQEKPQAEEGTAPPQRLALLKWMLANGADPEQLGGWPATRAIIAAAFVGEGAYVQALREAGAVIDGFVAAALGDIGYVDRTLSSDPGFANACGPGGLTALHCSAGSRLGAAKKKIQNDLLRVAIRLLDTGADVAACVRSWGHAVDAVHFAVSSGQREVFELLLERGADPTQALTPAVWRNETSLADLALRLGAELDRAIDEGKPLLNQMIRWGQFKQVEWMLERGASPNVADQLGWTAVHQAASRGNERVLKAVLDSGGDPHRRDNAGNTPLQIAKAKRRSRIIALLGS